MFETVFGVVGSASLVLLLLAVNFRQRGRTPSDTPPGADETRERLRTAVEKAAGGRLARVESYTHVPEDGAPIESGLRFLVTGLCQTIAIWRGGASASIGDPEFDLMVSVTGPHSPVFALLDDDCRAAMRSLLRGSVRITRFQIERGELTAHVPTMGFAQGHPGLDQVAEAIGTLARHFDTPADVVPLLARNAHRDPLVGVRLKNLGVLLDEHPKDPRTREAIREAFRDPDQGVRLRAALAAGAEGHPVLVDLALSPSSEDGYAAQAIGALGSALPLDRLEPLVREAADGRSARRATVTALIVALGRNPASAALALLSRLATTADDAFGAEAVDAIVAIPRPQVERKLIELLGTSAINRRGMVRAAAYGLGEKGTADAVLPLKEAAARHGETVASAARGAIAAIQSRLSGTPGELALAGDEEGRLTLSTDESGRVSLPPGKPDRD